LSVSAGGVMARRLCKTWTIEIEPGSVVMMCRSDRRRNYAARRGRCCA
jgi:hypothetical protein